jgi:hypothetical protein
MDPCLRRSPGECSEGLRLHQQPLADRAAARRAIRHIRTRPYSPRTNGKVEGFNQTLQREGAYALQYASSDARRQALPHWINHYNERRTHSRRSATDRPEPAFGTSPGSTASRSRIARLTLQTLMHCHSLISTTSSSGSVNEVGEPFVELAQGG